MQVCEMHPQITNKYLIWSRADKHILKSHFIHEGIFALSQEIFFIFDDNTQAAVFVKCTLIWQIEFNQFSKNLHTRAKLLNNLFTNSGAF